MAEIDVALLYVRFGALVALLVLASVNLTSSIASLREGLYVNRLHAFCACGMFVATIVLLCIFAKHNIRLQIIR